MFVRMKRNPSGTTCVSVVFKNGRTFKEVHHLGSSADPAEIQRMYNEGREWIALYGGQQLIDFEEKWREHQAEAAAVEQAIAEVKNSLSRVESTTLDALYGSVAITKRPPTVATLSSCGPPAPFQLIRNGLA